MFIYLFIYFNFIEVGVVKCNFYKLKNFFIMRFFLNFFLFM